MQRKLVKYDVFDKINENSLTSAQYELIEAIPIVSSVLKTGPLKFHAFDGKNVMYETNHGTYIHARYKLNPHKGIMLENIEELVIDEDSHREQRLSLISQMLEAILEDNKVKSDGLFGDVTKLIREQYRKTAGVRNTHRVNESIMDTVTRQKGNDGATLPVHDKQKMPSYPGCGRGVCKKVHDKVVLKARGVKKKLEEWRNLTDNVFSYVEFVEHGRILEETNLARNDRGDVVSMQIPTSKLRNEGKILMAQWETLKADVKVMRENALRLAQNKDFAQAMAELKRHNRLSDNESLQETLNSVISKWPHLLYLTQPELAKVIGYSLDYTGVTNYDDQTCDFMSEGILRTAHDTYKDRVVRILSLAKSPLQEEVEDQYLYFQAVVNEFYPKLDEATALEMQVFVDLYNAALDVRRLALESNSEQLRQQASDYASELKDIIDGDVQASLESATEVACWLQNLIETNIETKDWSIEKEPHVTISGDHPDMWAKARHSYAPASDFSGDWGDPGPQISGDKVGYKGGAPDETRNRSWGNKGGADVYPSLSNPYVPKSGEYTMKGEPGVDKNHDAEGEAQWQSGDTWPNLQNPYVPNSVKVHVSDSNRVDDKTNS
jgi:hypothetical protein